MEPTTFPEVNAVYGEGQDEYKPLPAYRIDFDDGEIVTCWKLNFIERLTLLFTGKLWLSVLTFRKPLQPIRPTAFKPEYVNYSGDENEKGDYDGRR